MSCLRHLATSLLRGGAKGSRGSRRSITSRGRVMNYYLPNATARLLTESQLKKCKNLALILDKYAPQTAIQKSEGKSIWLKEIALGSFLDPRLTESVYRRWLNMTEAVGALRFSAVTDWRMVVGLGGESVLETDL